MKKRYQSLLPSIILALGILGATALSVSTKQSSWLVLIGPLMLAGAIVAAHMTEVRLYSNPRTSMGVTLMIAAAFITVSVIVALRDPTRVPIIIPILGSAAAVMLVNPSKCIGKA